MAPCLEGLLNTAPSAKAPERENEGEKSGWAHPGLQRRAKANPHLSMKIPVPPCVQRVCVCVWVYMYIAYKGMRSMCALMCSCAPRKALPRAQLPSFWRMVPFHLIYLSRKWTTHFSLFFSPLVSFSDTTPPSPFSLSFNSLYLIISSSPAVWLFPPVSNCAGDTTWSSSPPLGMPLISTFPSPSKMRSLDRSLAAELRDIFWWKHPAACSSFLLPPYVTGVSQRFRMGREAGERRCSLSNTTLYISPSICRKSYFYYKSKTWKDKTFFFGTMNISNDFLCIMCNSISCHMLTQGWCL